MIGARFGLTESGSASRPGRFHLNRSTVGCKAVDCLMRFGFDKPYVEKVYGQCFTEITYQVAVEREGKLNNAAQSTELLSVVVADLVSSCD